MDILSSYLDYISSDKTLSEQESQLINKLTRYIVLMADDVLLLASKKRAAIKKFGHNVEIVRKLTDEIENKKEKIKQAKAKLNKIKYGK